MVTMTPEPNGDRRMVVEGGRTRPSGLKVGAFSLRGPNGAKVALDQNGLS